MFNLKEIYKLHRLLRVNGADASSSSAGAGASQGAGATQPADPANPAVDPVTGEPVADANTLPENGEPVNGEGEAAPEDAGNPGSAEDTLSYNSDYKSDWQTQSENATPTTSDPQETPTTDDSSTEWFDDMVEKGKTDPEAAKELTQVAEAPIQEAETLGADLEGRDEFADKKRGEAEKETYEKAVGQRELLKTLAKKAEVSAKQFPKDSPIRQSLMEQSARLKQSAKKLDAQLKSYEARKEDGKLADDSNKYQQLILKKQGGGELSAKEAKQLKQFEKKYPSFKAGNADLYRKQASSGKKPQTTDPPKKGGEEGGGKTGEKPEGDSVKKKGDSPKEVETGEQTSADGVETPPDEQLPLAETAVAQQVDPKTREERLTAFRERRKKIEEARDAFIGGGKELDKAKGENALQAGAEALVERSAPKEVKMRYRDAHRQGYEDLKGGTGNICGLVYFDGTVAEAASGGQSVGDQNRGGNILLARPGTVQFDQNKAKADSIWGYKEKSSNDLELGKPGGIFGYFTAWVPQSERNRMGVHFVADGRRGSEAGVA